MTLWMGKLEVKIMHLGRGHTKGDTVVWIPSQKILFSGDLVEADAACYTGDAYLADWPATLDALAELGAEKMIPGRGPALLNPERVQAGLAYTKDFVSTLYRSAQEAVAQGMDLAACMRHTRANMDPKFANVFIYEHCLPFDVTRAHDEASGIRDPRIWTAERDQQMWHSLQAA
jgi:glyoxylase-like metal-dependent hydrolase (beta-lactamase superfamily II)